MRAARDTGPNVRLSVLAAGLSPSTTTPSSGSTPPPDGEQAPTTTTP